MISRITFLTATLLACAVVSGCATGTPQGPGGGMSTSTTGGSGGTGGNGTGGAGMVACGNGVIETGEDCDDGNLFPGDGCSSKCALETGFTCSGMPSICAATCGDGFIGGPEECDDQNTTAGDGCSANCTVEVGFSCKGVPSKCSTTCGDGVVGGTEQCDDHNLGDGDGCNKSCQTELGYKCVGAPSDCNTVCGDGIIAGAEVCDDGNGINGDGCGSTCVEEPGFNCSGEPTICTSVCGDGIVAADEECDDKNTASNDGCSAMCQKEPGWACSGAPNVCTPICGDGKIVGAEQCDDGNIIPGDGCSALCKTQYGYTCTGTPSVCKIVCGDGVIAGSEVCDDGNSANGDGCSSTCKVELHYTCTGVPSVCNGICGDGIKVSKEQCDDNNTTPGDGCSQTCTVESGYTCTGSPSTCQTVCGDGVVGGQELCDDGNSVSGDGCSSQCTLEGGYTCTGTHPTVCVGVCGDGILEHGEQCDDSNKNNGDCCSSTCQAEAGCEIESNDSITKANDFATIGQSGKVKGLVSPTSDVDYYYVVIPTGSPSGSLTATILDGPISGDTCASGKVDTMVSVLDPNGNLIASHDDISTSNKCSTLTVPALPPGKYYVTVKNGVASTKTYSYTLQISTTLAVCGNGTKEPGEQCDDSNVVGGDGCSATCTIEGIPSEVEPNSTFAQADARAADPTPVLFTAPTLLAGSIPANDKDIYKVQLAQSGVVRFETFDNINPANCTIAATRFRLYNASQQQIYTDATSGIANCSALVVNLAAGTYYLQVEAANVGAAIAGYFVEMSFPTDDGAEVEPNNTNTQATALPGTEMYVLGGHLTNSDADYFAVTVPAGASIRAEVIEGAAETCESLEVDSRLTLYSAAAPSTALADDDDNGRGSCSLLDGTGTTPLHTAAHNLAAGVYYLQVRASVLASSGTTGQFDYRLVVTIRP
ncbi:Multiple EGF-like-domain protein 3 precursor [Minicystis rosea]|nr:Multiple EGF-like-domain protein 3 precursor [Minicystis rosea]